MSHKNIKLPEEKKASLERHRKSFGDAWVEQALDAARATIYREENLVRDKEKSTSRSPYRCYSEGTTVWRRKDGQPITQDDIEAVKANRIGQGHTVIAAPGENVIVHKWFVDSSD